MVVKLLEDLSPLDRLSLIEISYSRLDTLFGSEWGCQAGGVTNSI